MAFSIPIPAMPPNLKSYLKWGLVFLLLLGNIFVVWRGLQEPAIPPIWKGPMVPGKPLALEVRPPRTMDKIAAEGEKPYAKEPLRDLVVPETPTDLRPPEPDPAESDTMEPALPPPKKGYLVQAGGFVLKMGAEKLRDRLKKHGLKPRIESNKEMVQLNNVQAGPFPSLAEAKESEVKLKAGGLDAEVEETWEGYIISIGKYYLLGYAVEAMEQAEGLEVKPLRMVKVDVALPMQKVVLGPFPDQQQAKEVSARISQLGLAVPVIKERTEMPEPPEPETPEGG